MRVPPRETRWGCCSRRRRRLLLLLLRLDSMHRVSVRHYHRILCHFVCLPPPPCAPEQRGCSLRTVLQAGMRMRQQCSLVIIASTCLLIPPPTRTGDNEPPKEGFHTRALTNSAVSTVARRCATGTVAPNPTAGVEVALKRRHAACAPLLPVSWRQREAEAAAAAAAGARAGTCATPFRPSFMRRARASGEK